jgi:hypothetical protein
MFFIHIVTLPRKLRLLYGSASARMIRRGLDTPSTIDLEIYSGDESSVFRCHEYTRVHHIVHFSDPAHRYIRRELCPILGCVFHTRESGEETRSCYQRADTDDADLMRTVFCC